MERTASDEAYISRPISVPKPNGRSVSFAFNETRTAVEGSRHSSSALPIAAESPDLDSGPMFVAFTPPEILSEGMDGREGSSMPNYISPTATSSPKKRIVYQVEKWEPLPPGASEHDDTDRASLQNPLELAQSLFSYIHDSMPYLPAILSPRASTPTSTSTDKYLDDYAIQSSRAAHPLREVQDSNSMKPRRHDVYKDRSTIVKTIETFIGLKLALLWLVIGRLVGYQ